MLTGCVTSVSNPASSGGSKNASTKIIVHYEADATEENRTRIVKAAESHGSSIVYHLNDLNILVVEVAAGDGLDNALIYFCSLAGVIGVNKDETYELD